MRKNFLAIYALAGALVASPVFTSCVDDSESASVTALRGAKAEQLKSVAAMNNAEAQAKLIYANAEAQLKAAEAALMQAQADYEAAEAKIKELEAQLKEDAYDAELAAKLAQAEAEKAKAEKIIAKQLGEAQKYQLELEAKIAELQAALLKAKTDLVTAEDGAAKAEIDRLEGLATTYSTVLTAYTTAQNQLANLKTAKLALEADLVDLNEAKEKQIAKNEATIKVIDQQIAYLKEYENYAEDVDALKNELTLKEAEKNKASDAAKALYKEYEEANQAFYDNEELEAMLEAIEENELVKMHNGGYFNEEGEYVSYTYDDGNNVINFAPYDPITKFDDSESAEIEKEDNKTFDYNPYDVEVETKDLRALDLRIEEVLAALDIKGLTESIEKKDEGLQAKYDAAVKASATAKEAYEKAAETDKAAKKQAYEDAMVLEEAALQALTNAKDNLKEAEENKAKLEKLYALVSTDTAKLMEAIEAYNKALKDAKTVVAEKYWAYEDANAVVTEIETEITAMNAALYGMTETYVSLYDYIYDRFVGSRDYYEDRYQWINDVASGGNLYFDVSGEGYNYESNNYYGWSSSRNMWINFYETYILQSSSTGLNGAETIQSLIEGLETQKENLLKANENISTITSKEQAIASKDAEIAGKEAVIAALEVKLNAAKAALDAALPAEEEAA